MEIVRKLPSEFLVAKFKMPLTVKFVTTIRYYTLPQKDVLIVPLKKAVLLIPF